MTFSNLVIYWKWYFRSRIFSLSLLVFVFPCGLLYFRFFFLRDFIFWNWKGTISRPVPKGHSLVVCCIGALCVFPAIQQTIVSGGADEAKLDQKSRTLPRGQQGERLWIPPHVYPQVLFYFIFFPSPSSIWKAEGFPLPLAICCCHSHIISGLPLYFFS